MENKRKTFLFSTNKDKRHYFYMLSCFIFLSVVLTLVLLLYKNPVPIQSPSFLPIIRRRFIAIIAMLLAAICQSLSTVSFQSITGNKLITPSLLGFEAIYSTINTIIIFFFGTYALVQFNQLNAFIIQTTLMVLFTLFLFYWLLNRKNGNIQLMLLIGIIIGTGLRTFSSFLKRMLSPTEYDVLQAKLFASVNNAEGDYFIIAVPIVIIVSILLLKQSKKLNILALGKSTSIQLGLNYNRQLIYTLTLISILMSISTALVGPMSFFGFLVAMLTYQIVKTFDHHYLLIMSCVLAYFILCVAYFIMYHIVSAQGVVSIIIEIFGGLIFLILLLKRGIV